MLATTCARGAPTPPGSPTAPSASMAGRIAFVSERDGNREIYVSLADGTAVRRLTDDPGENVGPAWSPDGSKIAFASNRGGSFALHLMSADGSGVRWVTHGPTDAGFPAWSPDGSTIAFAGPTTPASWTSTS